MRFRCHVHCCPDEFLGVGLDFRADFLDGVPCRSALSEHKVLHKLFGLEGTLVEFGIEFRHVFWLVHHSLLFLLVLLLGLLLAALAANLSAQTSRRHRDFRRRRRRRWLRGNVGPTSKGEGIVFGILLDADCQNFAHGTEPTLPQNIADLELVLVKLRE